MTPAMVKQLTTLGMLRETVAQWRAQRESVALVPTMGALHAGHLHLVEQAKHRAKRVVVSIFVNPTQFGPNEDFDRYPRPLARDVELLQQAGADAVWLPDVSVMYPHGFATSIHVSGVSEGLCGAARPGHFDGVATVVAKLLLQTAPDIALFGEKDYQQLAVIKRLVDDLNIPVEITGIPTVREADGLALSSRNQYLTTEERHVAPMLHKTLQHVAQQIAAGAAVETAIRQGKAQLLAAGFASVEYLELRAAADLQPLGHYQPPARLLIAARLGKTRLIDNIAIA